MRYHVAFEIDEWRRALTTSGTRFAALIGSFILVAFYPSMSVDPLFYGINLAALALVWVSVVSPQAPVKVHALLLSSAGLGLHLGMMYTGGFRVNTPLTGVFTMMVAALMLGRRGTFGAWVALLALDGAMVSWIGASGKAVAVWPESQAIAWRYVVTMSLFNAFIGSGVSSGVAMLAQKIDELDTYVGDLQAANDALEAERHKVVALQKMDLVGKLAAGIAHDFNNDLQVIIGWSYMLAEDAEEAGDRELLEACAQINTASDHASSLVTQLLTLGKRHVGVPEDVCLGALIEQMTPSIRRLLPSDVSLEVLIERDALVRVDPIQFHQVMLNLCLNARDAMPDGGNLVVRLTGDRGDMHVEVSDSGTGIPESLKDRIFEPFFSTKGEDRGTGLGLSTVRQIVSDSGGEIAVDSQVGAGTTFRFSLPTLEQEAVSRASVPERPELRLEGLDVLVVEDDQAVREVMTRTLEGAGASVRVAVDAPDAIVALEERMADVVFSDAIMPRGGVLPLYEWIAALGDEAPPFVLCSAYIESELMRRGVMAEEILLLRKPFSPRELIATASMLRARYLGADDASSAPSVH
jgi:signal transduction histidine kinase/CheY-like chemotaxis protein